MDGHFSRGNSGPYYLIASYNEAIQHAVAAKVLDDSLEFPQVKTAANNSKDDPLPQLADDLPPHRPASIETTLLVDILPVNLPSSRVDIDLVDFEKPFTLPNVTRNPEDHDNRDSEHDVEESLCIGIPSTNGADRGIELGGEDEHDKSETQPSAPYTEDSLMWDLINSVALRFPCLTETNMGLIRVSFLSSLQSLRQLT